MLLQDFQDMKFQNVIFDGELCIVDENGKEDFQGIIKEHNRKNHTIKNPKFLIFDISNFLSTTAIFSGDERKLL
jgi:ATP-dependent DNA ligase